jgi:hypothetical protein
MARMNATRRKKLYKSLVLRDGECCFIGGEPGNASSLVIDHADNDNSNNTLGNLHLICRSTNAVKNPRGSSRKIQSSMSMKTAEEMLRLEAAQASSAEFLKNMQAEPDFKHWLFSEIWRKARLPLNDVLDCGAAIARCSQATVNRYLKKECSRVRLYQIIEETDTKGRFVEFNPEWEELRKQEMDRRMDEYRARSSPSKLIKGVAFVEKDPKKKIDEKSRRTGGETVPPVSSPP